jgi:hypothetical protein
MAKSPASRSNKKAPSQAAVAWHEAKEAIQETINDANGLIVTFGGYTKVIGNEVFMGGLTPERRAKLTESLNVIRISAGNLLAVVKPITASLEKEISRKREERSLERLRVLDSELIEAILAYNEAAITSGHIDNVQSIVTDTVDSLNVATESTEATPVVATVEPTTNPTE